MSDQPKPPYVTFETRPIEDRTATIESGHFTYKDVIFAIVTPAGSRDRIEKVAEEWLKDLEEAVRQERFPAEWLSLYRQRYNAWLETRSVPEDGASIQNWPALSPGQVKTLLDINIRTVEEVAAMTEEAMARIGMGSRALKAKAQAYLDTSSGTGKVAEELASMRQQLNELLTRDAARETELKNLTAERDKLAKALEKEKT